jgi:hypothetical protein
MNRDRAALLALFLFAVVGTVGMALLIVILQRGLP